MKQIYRWKALDGNGLEHLQLCVDQGVTAKGMILGDRFGLPYTLRYTIACDEQWRVRELRVEDIDGTGLVLIGDGEGRWMDGEGRRLSELDGAIDVDLAASAFTNTLPLRRLGPSLVERTAIKVAYVSIPDLSCTLAHQAYTRLPAGQVSYEGIDRNFQATLEVDQDDIVVRYPDLFVRVAG
jgi:hypothetical protein